MFSSGNGTSEKYDKFCRGKINIAVKIILINKSLQVSTKLQKQLEKKPGSISQQLYKNNGEIMVGENTYFIHSCSTHRICSYIS